jgi:3,4-dihydroxy-2-butanone 4-phosphate synthase
MMREDGTMARLPEMEDWAAGEGIPIVNIQTWVKGDWP